MWATLLALGALLVGLPAASAGGSVFIVNTVSDHDDGACQPIKEGDCTLREAILASNADDTMDTIRFDIPEKEGNGDGTWTIVVDVNLGDLPTISKPLTLDGEPTMADRCRPRILLDGDLGDFDGLRVTANDTSIAGLAVGNFGEIGIVLKGVANGRIVCNWVGLALDGVTPLPNLGVGIEAEDLVGASTVIGEPGLGNVVSANDGDGIVIRNAIEPVIQANWVGLNADGEGGVGNGRFGLSLFEVAFFTLGGEGDGEGNVVASNGNAGINLVQTRHCGVVGNIVGLEPDGATPAGNGGHGIILADGVNCSLQGNLVGANAFAGMSIFGDTESSSIVANWIGTNQDGAPLGNQNGIQVRDVAHTLNIGLTAPGNDNTIAHNEGRGILIFGETTGTRVWGNSIHSNGALGITLDFDEVTPNDGPGDPDDGPNGLQNFPHDVQAGIGSTVATGRLHSTEATTFTLQFYSNEACDGSGHGEGQHFLGARQVTTDATGQVDWHFDDLPDAPDGHAWVTVTATGPDGTSEFSQCAFMADDPPPPVPELGTLALLAAGLVGLAAVARARRRS